MCAATLVGGPGEGLDGPVRLKPEEHLAAAHAHVAIAQRDPVTDIWPFRALAPVCLAAQRLQDFHGPRSTHVAARHGGVALAQAIAQAKLDRIYPQLAGEVIHVHFTGLATMERTGRAHISRWHQVGVAHV